MGRLHCFYLLESKLISNDENISFHIEGNKMTVDERCAIWEHTALYFPLQGRQPLRAEVILHLVSTCLKGMRTFLTDTYVPPLAIWTIETRHLIKLEPEFPPGDPIQRELKDTCLPPARGTICLLEKKRDFTQCQQLVKPSSMQENRAVVVMYQSWIRLHLDYDCLIMHISYSLLKFYPHIKTLKMNLVSRGIVWFRLLCASS